MPAWLSCEGMYAVTNGFSPGSYSHPAEYAGEQDLKPDFRP